ncbi:hypothetical protein H4Q26_011404 [Puccinia striiformis f. sp. tritici PST-130]|nr:hypothetical protein H4Q26_011404 [Puccinia striiformis f. sp. tritici PST-130]
MANHNKNNPTGDLGKWGYDVDILNDSSSMNMEDDSFDGNKTTLIFPFKPEDGPSSSNNPKTGPVNTSQSVPSTSKDQEMYSSGEEEEEDDQQEGEGQENRGNRADDQDHQYSASSSQHIPGSSAQTDNNSSGEDDDMDIEQGNEDEEDPEEEDDDVEDDDEDNEEGDNNEDDEEEENDDGYDDDDRGGGEDDDEQGTRSQTAEDDSLRLSRATSIQQAQQNSTHNLSPPPASIATTTTSHAQSPSKHEELRLEAVDQLTRLDLSPQSTTPTNTYRYQVSQRYQSVTKARTFHRAPIIDPLVFIPHGCSVHALAVPPCGSHLFSGGQDGFIRRISIHQSVTGSSAENLTMKQGGHVPLIDKDVDKTTIFSLVIGKMRITNLCNATQVSPVYSLAIHNEELWGLSGTESGNINLFTIRHDEGHIRHVFKASNPPTPGPLTATSDVRGHKPGSVISSIDLNSDQNIAFSGGWDGIVLGWDLNTGQVVNKFIAHASQISTVSMRPDCRIPIYDSKFEEDLMEREEEERRVDCSEQADEQVDQEKKMNDEDTEMKTVESVEVSNPNPTKGVESVQDKDSEEDGSLFGGADNSGSDLDETPEPSVPLASISPVRGRLSGGSGLILPSVAGGGEKSKISAPPLILPTIATNKAKVIAPIKPVLPPTNLTQVPSVLDSSLPYINDDILMTSGIDGQVYLWDRRISGTESRGYVRKLELSKSTSPWTACSSWSLDGRSIFVGRRNNSVDIYDLRFIHHAHSRIHNPSIVQRSIKLPTSSGPVSCVKAWPDHNHILCASFDNLRLYNLNAIEPSSHRKSTINQIPKIPFKIIPGHSSGVVSQMCITPSFRFLITASGDRAGKILLMILL